MASGPIFALDLATVSGWAEGLPGERPSSGTHRFTAPGSSLWATFWAALKFANERFQLVRYQMVIIEAPLPPTWMKGATNIKTTLVLFGLPAVIGAVAYGRGIYAINTAKVSDVRHHFIGSNPRGARGKELVIEKCREKGWVEATGKVDDNRADALALWSYACASVDPASAVRVTPLFSEERA